MTATAAIGLGLTFDIGDGATPVEVFTPLALLRTQLDLSGIAHDPVESTHTLSTEGYREYIPGLREGGSVSFTLIFDVDGTNNWLKLKSEFAKQTPTNYRISHPDGTTKLLFRGFLTSISVPMPIDGLMEVNVEYKITGKPGLLATQ